MPIVDITMIEGRSAELKEQLIRKVTDAVEAAIGAPRATIRVVLREVPSSNWGVGGEPRG